MIEGRAARRILKQPEKFRRSLIETANPSVMNADRVVRQSQADGFITLDKGIRVLVDTAVQGLRKSQRPPLLGGYTLESDLQCSITAWLPQRVNTHAPKGSGTLIVVPTSSREMQLRTEAGEFNANIQAILSSDEMPEHRKQNSVETHEIMLRAIHAELEDEWGKLASKTLAANPGLLEKIERTRLHPARISELIFTVATDRFIDLR